MYDELIGDLRYCDKGDCNGCRRYTRDTRYCNTLLREAADAIEELSARDRKPDHWIVSASEDYAGGGYVKCGHCGYKFSWAGYFSADEWKFCPECGWPKEAPDEPEE